MHLHAQMIRRIVAILGAAVVAGALLTAAAASGSAATGFSATLKAFVAGGITHAGIGDELVVVATATNPTSHFEGIDVDLTYNANLTMPRNNTCVLRGSTNTVSPDSPGCEWGGGVAPGQRASNVAVFDVTGSAGSVASVQACALNDNNTSQGVCKTLNVKV